MHRRPPPSIRRLSTSRPPVTVTVGIRREDPKRIWERRAPLTPDTVHYLVSEKNVHVHIEPCDRRVFSDVEYAKAGACIRSNLSNAHIIVGIKETPLEELITSPIPTPTASRSRTHVMFSHTHKGQPYNTPLLARFVGPSQTPLSPSIATPRLIDYELLTDEDGKRTVAFGWFAGVAGVFESLSAMAHSHLQIGIASPFLYTPRPHTHPSLDSLRAALRSIGNRIADEGTPASLGPFVIGLTGNGNVSQGCLAMLEELPLERVRAKDLPALVANKDADRRKIYLVHTQLEEYLVRLDGGTYNREHYYANPQSYRSTFAETVAPYLTLLLNGIGWSNSFPRLMTNEQLTVALERAQALGGARFTNIGDISCDVEGGLEFLTRATTLSSPSYTVRPLSLPASLPSINMMSVDILPASLPLDASVHFSGVLLPYLEGLVGQYRYLSDNGGERKGGGYDGALARATIAEGGRLKERHGWLQGDVDRFYGEEGQVGQVGVFSPSASKKEVVEKEKGEQQHQESGVLRKKRVLMLGSGMVAGPAVDEIAKRGDVQLLIASNSVHEMEKLARGYENVQCRVIDIGDKAGVAGLVGESDLVISLLPAALHVDIAELCISLRKHLVTASYISPGMRALNDRALEADVLLLNEIGLDPGIDHCSAVDLVSRLRAQGKEVVSFTSFCGGLPAPEVEHVPLRYKFSWSPKGVLSAALNGARYLLDGRVVNVDADDLLDKKSYFERVPITSEFEMEGIPNRDSLGYAGVYGIEGARTVLRGTLRYPGFVSLMSAFKQLGLLETTQRIHPQRWTAVVPQAMEARHGMQVGSVGKAVAAVVPAEQHEELFAALEWLGLVPPRHHQGQNQNQNQNRNEMPSLPKDPMAPIDVFARLLAERLRYESGERDMVVLSHEVVARPPAARMGAQGEEDGQKEEVYTSQLITYGTPRASAMARTVGLPVAFAALNVLDGKVGGLKGVCGPVEESVYRPVLRRLEEVGLGMEEKMRVVSYGRARGGRGGGDVRTVERTLAESGVGRLVRKGERAAATA